LKAGNLVPGMDARIFHLLHLRRILCLKKLPFWQVKDMLLEVLLLLTGFWLFFVLRKILFLFLLEQNRDEQLCKLTVLLGDQEEAAEGFLRKLIHRRNGLWPKLEVEVADCGAGDGTRKIIHLLARELNFPIVEKALLKQTEQTNRRPPKDKKPSVRYLDTRGYNRKSLLKLPFNFFYKK